MDRYLLLVTFELDRGRLDDAEKLERAALAVRAALEGLALNGLDDDIKTRRCVIEDMYRGKFDRVLYVSEKNER